MNIKKILTYESGTDTRDNSILHIYKIDSKLSKDEYITLKQELKKHSCYYSKFVKGFVSKTILDDNLEIDMNVDTKTKETNKSQKVEYFKNVLDYITMGEYKTFLESYSEKNLYKSWAYRNSPFKNNEDALKMYKKELFDNLENALKYDFFGKLGYIREIIIHKSLGFTLDDDRINTNGDNIYYKAIWDKLPTIENLELTNQTYSAVWGYDQTNVDIAHKLNKKVWGLDVLKDNSGHYYLVRMKNDSFHDNVRYFSRDKNPTETFKRDASQTGQYR